MQAQQRILEDTSDDISRLIQTLRKDPSDRTSTELNRLKHLIKECRFLIDEPGFSWEDAKDIALSFKYFSCPSGEPIEYLTNVPSYVLFSGKLRICNHQTNSEKVVEAPFTLNPDPHVSCVALTKCHLCYIESHIHKKILQNIASRVFNKHVDFFLSLPAFAKWSRTAMRKVVAKTEILTFKRSEAVYSAGTLPECVYIVKNGEYELLKGCMERKAKEQFLESFIGPPGEREKRKRLHAKYSPNRRSIGVDFTIEKYTLLLKIEGKGQVLGDIEAVEGTEYKYFVKCKSLLGELYKIPIDIFKDIIMGNLDTKQYMEKVIAQKKQFLESRANNAKVFKEEETKSRNTSFREQANPHQRKLSIDLFQARTFDKRSYRKELNNSMDENSIVLPKISQISRATNVERYSATQSPKREIFSPVRYVLQKPAATLGTPKAVPLLHKYSLNQRARAFTLQLCPVAKKATL